jgi:hypothetical protein
MITQIFKKDYTDNFRRRFNLCNLIFNLCNLLLFFSLICFAEEQFIYSSKGKRDPFVPLVTPEGSYVVDLEEIGSAADIRLEGVVYDPQGRSIAIVNGIVIKEGDIIKGFELIKIETDRIVLSKDGELYMVRLQKER